MLCGPKNAWLHLSEKIIANTDRKSSKNNKKLQVFSASLLLILIGSVKHDCVVSRDKQMQLCKQTRRFMLQVCNDDFAHCAEKLHFVQ